MTATSERLLDASGYLGWLTVGYVTGARALHGEVSWWWALAWLCYGVLFTLVVWRGARLGRHAADVVLGALVVLGMVVVLLDPRSGFNVVLYVVTVVTVAQVWRTRVALAVVVLQTAALAVGWGPSSGVEPAQLGGIVLSYVAFQLFALLTTTVMGAAVRAREELAEAHERLREAQAARVEASRAQERLRIARDLHDRVGHQLTALSLQLEVAGHRTEGPARDQVLVCRDLSKDLLQEVRGVVGTLRTTPTATSSLASRLRELGAGWPRPLVHVEVDDAAAALDGAPADVVVALVREAVTNSARHSSASTVWVAVDVISDEATVTVRDDGEGAAHVVPGHGLIGMRERVEALGGAVRWAGGPGTGFRVQASVPVAS